MISRTRSSTRSRTVLCCATAHCHTAGPILFRARARGRGARLCLIYLQLHRPRSQIRAGNIEIANTKAHKTLSCTRSNSSLHSTRAFGHLKQRKKSEPFGSASSSQFSSSSSSKSKYASSISSASSSNNRASSSSQSSSSDNHALNSTTWGQFASAQNAVKANVSVD